MLHKAWQIGNRPVRQADKESPELARLRMELPDPGTTTVSYAEGEGADTILPFGSSQNPVKGQGKKKRKAPLTDKERRAGMNKDLYKWVNLS